MVASANDAFDSCGRPSSQWKRALVTFALLIVHHIVVAILDIHPLAIFSVEVP